MSDHADIVRDWLALDPRADWEADPDEFGDAIAALDALVAALATSERSRDEYIEETIRLRESLFAAEAEVARLRAGAEEALDHLRGNEPGVAVIVLAAALGEEA